jgi:predicted N-acyltransferase
MLARQHTSIDQLDPKAWNALAGTQAPFLRHEFLAALEHTGCVGEHSGWTPAYITLHDDAGLAAAAPAFLKSHSYGEFVFDFSWAEAYGHFGRSYYPKLSVCVPFTPATGARLLVRPDLDAVAVRRKLARAIQDFVTEHRLSSAHALFFDEPGREAFEESGWLLRRDCQFHWVNQGFGDFEQYLATFTAEKRKKARRERRRVAESGIHFETRFGTDIDAPLMDAVYGFHRGTFLRHGHEPYLSREFFSEVTRTMGEALMFKIAMQGAEPVAAAVFFWSPEALYGRYWGSAEEHHSLHFETCYHQGIEFCIERGIGRFEPGTQGEHKVARGFAPTLTWSAHYIGDRSFRAAVRDYLVREGAAVDAYATQVGEHVPFRQPP